MQSELLAQIAKLPNTTVAPYRDGGGVQIIEQYSDRVRFTGVWLTAKAQCSDCRTTCSHASHPDS